jgi:hypothetical protein
MDSTDLPLERRYDPYSMHFEPCYEHEFLVEVKSRHEHIAAECSRLALSLMEHSAGSILYKRSAMYVGYSVHWLDEAANSADKLFTAELLKRPDASFWKSLLDKQRFAALCWNRAAKCSASADESNMTRLYRAAKSSQAAASRLKQALQYFERSCEASFSGELRQCDLWYQAGLLWQSRSDYCSRAVEAHLREHEVEGSQLDELGSFEWKEILHLESASADISNICFAEKMREIVEEQWRCADYWEDEFWEEEFYMEYVSRDEWMEELACEINKEHDVNTFLEKCK